MSAASLPQDVVELQTLLGPLRPGQTVQAVPGTGTNVPLWILGSSLFGAQLAAALGLPYAFASHFAPDDLMEALAAYRASFRPSAALASPYAMVAANVVVAETDEAARRLFTSIQQGVANLLRGARGLLQPPLADIDAYWTPAERAHASRMLACSFVGSPATVRTQLEHFVARTRADEIIVAAGIFDQVDKLRSFELLSQVIR
jgi:luciferase family oxidoreductase group 1